MELYQTIIAGVLLALTGCKGAGGNDGDTHASLVQGGAGGGTPSLGACPTNLAGPSMSLIQAPRAPYCIDNTEVTQAQYQAFLDAKVSIADQPTSCAWNYTYEFEPIHDSSPPWHNCKEGQFDPATQGDLPMMCVDWCDARAYCSWAGKHLCGAIGGGSVPVADASDVTKSEWRYACSNGGNTKYPYGDTYVPGQCTDATVTKGNDMPFPAAVGCAGEAPPFSSIVNLSGNVWEWLDGCDGKGGCMLAGGGRGVTGDPLSCAFLSYNSAQFQADTGFRCCLE